MQKVKEVTHKAKEAMTGGHHDPHPTTKPSTHAGPHTSGLANQVDPRIDSDRDGSHNAGLAHNTGTHGTGYGTGTHGFSGTHGTGTGTGYGTADHTGHTGGAYGTTGTGTGLTGHQSAHPTTQPSTHAGPHGSGLANQVDPRVDSDRDGSNNMGFAGGQHATYTNDTKELPDAAKHPPTVFAKIAGGTDPEVGHAGDPVDHRRRHSLKVTDTAATLERYGPGQ